MGLLDIEYEPKGNDDVSLGGKPEARVQDLKIDPPKEVKSKFTGKPYIQIDFTYKDDNGKERAIKYQRFNPTKSEAGKQLWVNLLTVAGATTGKELKGKMVKAVLRPEEYFKEDGSKGITYKPVANGYFSKDGLSAGEITDGKEEGAKMLELLAETLELGLKEVEAKPEAPAPATESDEDFDSMPF